MLTELIGVGVENISSVENINSVENIGTSFVWMGNFPNVAALWVLLMVARVYLLGFIVFNEEDTFCDLLSV